MIKFIRKKKLSLSKKFKKWRKTINLLNLLNYNKIKICNLYKNKKNKISHYFINYGLSFIDL